MKDKKTKNKNLEPNPVILPLFSHPVYKEMTDFRFNPAELKLVHSLTLEIEARKEGSLSPLIEISKDREIFKKKGFKRVREFIDGKAQHFFKKCLFLKNELIITKSWVTRGKPSTAHHSHRHPNALFSLVYYIDCPAAHLRFSRNDNFMDEYSLFSYDFKQFNLYTARQWTIPVTTGLLLIFPASLFHQSSPNLHSTDKWVFSCNYFLKTLPALV
jgi:uncharacterized protein (TIGR02466 family)